MKIYSILFLSTIIVLACSVSMTGISTTYSNTTSIVSTPPNPVKVIIEPTIVFAYVTAEDAVNVRTKPDEHSPHVRYLYHVDIVQIYECRVTSKTGLWAKIDDGWVNADYLTQNACK